jgi:hypothetical protein
VSEPVSIVNTPVLGDDDSTILVEVRVSVRELVKVGGEGFVTIEIPTWKGPLHFSASAMLADGQ